MILTCPNCGTQYVVKDGAIPPEGRQVRCASCKHSWHQDPEYSDAVAQVTSLADADEQSERQSGEPRSGEDESVAEATLIEPRSGPEAEERAYEEAIAGGEAPPAGAHDPEEVAGEPLADSETPDQPVEDWRGPPQGEAEVDVYSPFMAADNEAPRKRGRLVQLLLVALIVAALGAAFWMLAPPAWKA